MLEFKAQNISWNAHDYKKWLPPVALEKMCPRNFNGLPQYFIISYIDVQVGPSYRNK